MTTNLYRSLVYLPFRAVRRSCLSSLSLSVGGWGRRRCHPQRGRARRVGLVGGARLSSYSALLLTLRGGYQDLFLLPFS
jgi:hypothetical protein